MITIITARWKIDRDRLFSADRIPGVIDIAAYNARSLCGSFAFPGISIIDKTYNPSFAKKEEKNEQK